MGAVRTHRMLSLRLILLMKPCSQGSRDEPTRAKIKKGAFIGAHPGSTKASVGRDATLIRAMATMEATKKVETIERGL